MQNLYLMITAVIPMSVALLLLLTDRWRRKRAGEKSPLPKKLLRPAGHSLMRRMDDLNDNLSQWISGSFLTPLAGAFVLSLPGTEAARWGVLITSWLLGAGFAVLAWRNLKRMRHCRLGLLGEQSVAEQLSSLVAQRCRVFHDVPGDGNGNIDHVVVGPAGVFAIETKARTKRPGKHGRRDCDAVFDGKAIQFPWGGYDSKALDQARGNARWLTTMLSKATGERVTAQPIVALPGWFVTLKANSDVKVLSGKQVPGFIATEPATLSDKLIQQISYQLEQRCRDVEF